jgi:hypothetical protein
MDEDNQNPELPQEPEGISQLGGVPEQPQAPEGLTAMAGLEGETPVEGEISEEEEAPITDTLQLLLIGISKAQLVQITYTKMNGETKMYVAEPYEIGGNKNQPAGYFWGHDIDVDHIKSFLLSNISDVKLLPQQFIPRY